ncbi:MAG: helix-turn-helix domain-containing protein [Microthrixaceae bacterium]|nr:helix-turn-helix domain-containing protein [Microthrixaceae bacterium]
MDAASILRTARRRQGLTQAEVALRVGTSQPVISAYEHGTRDPSVTTLSRLIAGTGEHLELRLADTGSKAVTPAADRGAALVDVLLLADAIPVRRAPGPLLFPRIDSTRR